MQCLNDHVVDLLRLRPFRLVAQYKRGSKRVGALKEETWFTVMRTEWRVIRLDKVDESLQQDGLITVLASSTGGPLEDNNGRLAEKQCRINTVLRMSMSVELTRPATERQCPTSSTR